MPVYAHSRVTEDHRGVLEDHPGFIENPGVVEDHFFSGVAEAHPGVVEDLSVVIHKVSSWSNIS